MTALDKQLDELRTEADKLGERWPKLVLATILWLFTVGILAGVITIYLLDWMGLDVTWIAVVVYLVPPIVLVVVALRDRERVQELRFHAKWLTEKESAKLAHDHLCTDRSVLVNGRCLGCEQVRNIREDTANCIDSALTEWKPQLPIAVVEVLARAKHGTFPWPTAIHVESA